MKSAPYTTCQRKRLPRHEAQSPSATKHRRRNLRHDRHLNPPQRHCRQPYSPSCATLKGTPAALLSKASNSGCARNKATSTRTANGHLRRPPAGTRQPTTNRRSPLVVIEILIPTTEATDRRENSAPIAPCQPPRNTCSSAGTSQVEIYRRRGDIGWDIITEPGDTIEIASLEIKLDMDDIYFESSISC